MTRKHFIRIAQIIKEAKEDCRGGTPAEGILLQLENDFADYLSTQNSNFDCERFFDACSID